MNKFLFIIFFFPLMFCSQQNKIDSLFKVLKKDKEDTSKVKHLNLIANEFQNLNIDSAIYKSNQALALAKKTNWIQGIAQSEHQLAWFNFLLGNYEISLNYNKTALALWENLIKSSDKGLSLEGKKGRGRTIGNMGTVYVNQSDYNKALEYYFRALNIDKELDNKRGIALWLGNIGVVYKEQSKYSEALDYYFEALKMDEVLGNKNGVARHFGNIGGVYKELANYPKALDNYFKAVKINQTLGNKKEMALWYSSIGLIYSDQRNYQKAFYYLFISLKIDEELGLKHMVAKNINNIGKVYADRGNQNKALDYYLRAQKAMEELGDKSGVAMCLGNIGNVYLEQLRNNEANQILLEALKINEELNNKTGIIRDLGNLGSVYMRTHKYEEAERCFKKALALSVEIKALDHIRNNEFALSRLYDTIGRKHEAFEFYKKYIVARDSILNIENQKKQMQSEMNFEFEKKELLAKAEQDKKDAVATGELKQKEKERNYFIAGFVIVAILALFIFRGNRQIQKANVVITEQKKLVDEKHKEITDSINYAERIQRSFLATKQLLDENLSDYFVFFQPKDVVSGDFYWAAKLSNGNFLLATSDSTGHGVPGAIMSILNISCLEKSVEEQKLLEPGKILNHTRSKIIERLKKDGSKEGGKDGMDCSLLCLDFENMKLTYAAANNPAWIIRENKIIELAPDKMPVGRHDNDTMPFTQHAINMHKNDLIYTFTDGMPDQFGGPKGKKFMYKKLKETLLSVSLTHKSLSKQKEIIEQSLNEWKGNLEQVDDITVIGIRV